MVRLREECEKLHSDRKVLKERVGFSYPEKYRSYVMFEEMTKRGTEGKEEEKGFAKKVYVGDDLNLTPPEGVNELEYLKAEESKILSDIFTLVSFLSRSLFAFLFYFFVGFVYS